jgi:hypothetical protein
LELKDLFSQADPVELTKKEKFLMKWMIQVDPFVSRAALESLLKLSASPLFSSILKSVSGYHAAQHSIQNQVNMPTAHQEKHLVHVAGEMLELDYGTLLLLSFQDITSWKIGSDFTFWILHGHLSFNTGQKGDVQRMLT